MISAEVLKLVRRRGLMVGIELVRDRRNKEEYAYGDRIGHRVCMAARRLGDVVRESISEVCGG